MLKFQLISDVHQRWDRVTFDPTAQLIVALGDIADGTDGIPWLASQNRPVIYVPGNHEYYGADIADRLEQLRSCAQGTQVIIADQITIKVGKTRFLCATLWTDHNCMDPDLMAHSLASLNDYRNIKVGNWLSLSDNQHKYTSLLHDFELRNPQHKGLLPQNPERMNPLVTLALHQEGLNYMIKELSTPWDGYTVILTHHAPSLNSLVMSRYFATTKVKKFPQLLNLKHKPHKIGAYANSLEYLLANHKIQLWLHGHLHEGLRYCINGADIISNPTGYVDTQNERYHPALILTPHDPVRHIKTLCLMLYQCLQAQSEIATLIKKQIMQDEKDQSHAFAELDDFFSFSNIYNQTIAPLLQQSAKDRNRPDFIIEPINMNKIASIFHELPTKLHVSHKTRFFHEMLTKITSNEKRTRDWLIAQQGHPALSRWTVEGDIESQL